MGSDMCIFTHKQLNICILTSVLCDIDTTEVVNIYLLQGTIYYLIINLQWVYIL